MTDKYIKYSSQIKSENNSFILCKFHKSNYPLFNDNLNRDKDSYTDFNNKIEK